MVVALSFAALAVLPAVVPTTAEPCPEVISYTRYLDTAPEGQRLQWRLLDPRTGLDTLFLALVGGPGGVRWDPDHLRVEFSDGGVIKRAAWQLGAEPRAITSLPPDRPAIDEWWFNPDSSCWQAAATRLVNLARPGGSTEEQCAFALWQSSPDGGRWRIVRADASAHPYGCEWPWEGDPSTHREPMVTLEDVGQEMDPDTWETREVGPIQPDSYEEPWVFCYSPDTPQQGIVLRLIREDQTGVRGPAYYVDLERDVTRQICPYLPTDDFAYFYMKQVCGYAVIVAMGEAILLDMATGAETVLMPEAALDCVWVAPPRGWPRR